MAIFYNLNQPARMIIQSITQKIDNWLHRLFKNKPRLRQVSWFIMLWLFGLFAVTMLSLPIKLLVTWMK